MTHEHNARIAQAVGMLTAQLDAAKVLSSGPAYDEARQVWNAAVTRRPAVIVLCESTGDVQASIRVATTCGLSLSVRGGGHDWAGRASSSSVWIDATPGRSSTGGEPITRAVWEGENESGVFRCR